MITRTQAAARRGAERDVATRRAARIVAPALPELRAPDEAVLKLISSTPSRASAGRMAWYVGRVRPQDRDDPGCAGVRLRDETGAVLSRGGVEDDFERTREAVRRAFEALDLPTEAENRKRAAADDEAPRADELRHTVVHHLAFSVRLREPGEAGRAELAAEAAIREAFGAEGYRCLWAMHDEKVAGAPGSGHAHVHFHAIVKATQEHGGRRLRFGPGAVDIQDLREVFAGYASAVGLDAQATRREDREELRRAVADGDAVLRPHRLRSPARQRSALARRAPLWALEHEAALQRRRATAQRRRDSGRPAWPEPPAAAPPPAPGPLDRALGRRRRRPGGASEPRGPVERALARLQGIYLEPGEALASWRAMRAELEAKGETGAFADWYLTHRPETFGEATMAAWRRGNCVLAGDRGFRALLREAAREMAPPAIAPLAGPEAEARSAAAARRAAAAAETAGRLRRAADIRSISSSLARVAAVLDRDRDVEGDGRGLARRVREAANATLARAAAAARVAPGRAAPRPGRPGGSPERG